MKVPIVEGSGCDEEEDELVWEVGDIKYFFIVWLGVRMGMWERRCRSMS